MHNYYPSPDAAKLKAAYVGQSLDDLDTPAAIIDLAKVKHNCRAMLQAADELGLGFRAHTKTHKTLEGTGRQVGNPKGPGSRCNLVVSTVAELDFLCPLLNEYIHNDAEVEVIYGVPLSRTNFKRLAAVIPQLAGGKVSLLVDHVEQLEYISQMRETWPAGCVYVFIKIDTGYHRAGVLATSDMLKQMATHIRDQKDYIELRGLYSHYGHSYAGNSPTEAITGLREEIEGLLEARIEVAKIHPPGPILTIGATPTATAAQVAVQQEDPETSKLKDSIARAKGFEHEIELHAGVYPFLDMQQVATRAKPANPIDSYPGLSTQSIALTILVEVVSLYPDREKPEVLVSAGSLALGREPCKSYPGWGVVSSWRTQQDPQAAVKDLCVYDPESNTPTGWIVGRIAQEHAILTWQGSEDKRVPLQIGQKLRLFPNHACVAGVGFGWYYVVDSESSDENVVRDVWVRGRGW